MLKDRLKDVLPTTFDLDASAAPFIKASLGPLEDLQGDAIALLPQTIFVEVSADSAKHYLTLVHNNSHLNITSLFGEQKRRVPEEDTLSVVPGFIGAYPNAFFSVRAEDLDHFADSIASMRSEADYTRLLDNYGVRRTNAAFWKQSDAFHAAFEQNEPVAYGIFDYGRLENR